MGEKWARMGWHNIFFLYFKILLSSFHCMLWVIIHLYCEALSNQSWSIRLNLTWTYSSTHFRFHPSISSHIIKKHQFYWQPYMPSPPCLTEDIICCIRYSFPTLFSSFRYELLFHLIKDTCFRPWICGLHLEEIALCLQSYGHLLIEDFANEMNTLHCHFKSTVVVYKGKIYSRTSLGETQCNAHYYVFAMIYNLWRI